MDVRTENCGRPNQKVRILAAVVRAEKKPIFLGNERLLLGNERLLLGNERLLLEIIGVFGCFGFSFFVAGGFSDSVGRGARRVFENI